MTSVFQRWESSQTRYQGSYSGPRIPLNCGVAGVVCRLTPARPGLLHSLERGNLQGSSSPFYLEEPATFHVGQVPRSDPGLTSDLEGTRVC